MTNTLTLSPDTKSFLGIMAEDRKSGPSKRTGEKKDVRLAPIYATQTLAERINAELEATEQEFADFGRTAIEFYLNNKGARLPNQVRLEFDAESYAALEQLARDTRFRGNATLLLEHLAYSAIENGGDVTVEFIFRPTDEKLGISRMVDDKLNTITDDDADKKRREARKKEA